MPSNAAKHKDETRSLLAVQPELCNSFELKVNAWTN